LFLLIGKRRIVGTSERFCNLSKKCSVNKYNRVENYPGK